MGRFRLCCNIQSILKVSVPWVKDRELAETIDYSLHIFFSHCRRRPVKLVSRSPHTPIVPYRHCCIGVVRYELQYAVAGRVGGSGDDAAVWQAVEGNGKDTWDITVRVDGFDRYGGRCHNSQRGYQSAPSQEQYWQ